jgi:hypothetical protein
VAFWSRFLHSNRFHTWLRRDSVEREENGAPSA